MGDGGGSRGEGAGWTFGGVSQQAAEGGRSAASTGEKGLARGSGEWGQSVRGHEAWDRIR